MKPIVNDVKVALKDMFDIVMDDASSETERGMACNTLIDGLLPNQIWMKKPPYSCGTCHAQLTNFEWVEEHQCFRMPCIFCNEEWYT